MKEIKDFLLRNAAWIILGIVAFFLLGPAIQELRTLFIISATESLAIALSGLAAFAYTKINFIQGRVYNALGNIFLAVHLLVGLVVLGVYIAQFTN
jgi:drug/metabolite transporter superfamily protein YnfA